MLTKNRNSLLYAALAAAGFAIFVLLILIFSGVFDKPSTLDKAIEACQNQAGKELYGEKIDGYYFTNTYQDADSIKVTGDVQTLKDTLHYTCYYENGQATTQID